VVTRIQNRRHASPGENAQHGVTKIAVVLLVGVSVLSVGVMASAGPKPAAGAIGAGVTMFLLFAASAAIGAALGFLFGLPRARFTDELSGAAASTGATGGAPVAPRHPSAHYLANSNLIKVSDWLTTIVIGLGLVNLGGLLPALRTLATALKDPLGGTAYAGAIGISVMVIGVLAGFVLVYVFTTIRIRQLLEDSEDQEDSEDSEDSEDTPGTPVQVASKIEVAPAADAAGAQGGASGSGHRAGNVIRRIPRQ
jgi:hypothetical protein